MRTDIFYGFDRLALLHVYRLDVVVKGAPTPCTST